MSNNWYNNSNFNNQRGNFISPRLFQGAIKEIIIANAAVFFVMFILGLAKFFTVYFGLVPKLVWSKGFVWQPLTYMFIHGGLGHIFWNMFILWMFGMELENFWGKKEFWRFYIVTGVGSGVLTMLFSLNSQIPVVGASGAIYAVLLAFGLMFPDRKIYIYFLIPVRAKYLVLLMGVITFISTFSPGQSNISHLTHLGGLIIGYLYLNRRKRINFSTLRIPKFSFNFKNPFTNIIRTTQKKNIHQEPQDYPSDYDSILKQQLNTILDKINKYGYDKLTSEEQKTLLTASEYFAKKNKQN